MKIVQSFWSLPYSDATAPGSLSRFGGGWPHPIFNWLSWTLSCLKFREHYKQVELITDLEGKKILIEGLGLPYTQVSTELENIRSVNAKVWAFGKIYSYALQRKPF